MSNDQQNMYTWIKNLDDFSLYKMFVINSADFSPDAIKIAYQEILNRGGIEKLEENFRKNEKKSLADKLPIDEDKNVKFNNSSINNILEPIYNETTNRKDIYYYAIIIIIGVWAFFASLYLYSKNSELQLSIKENAYLKNKIDSIKTESENKIQEALLIKEKAQKFIQREEKKLHNVFGSLFYYREGYNQVNGNYIKSIVIYGNNIKIFIQNNSSEIIFPRFTIYLLNEYGFITGQYHREYTFWDDGIKSGETKVDEGYIYNNFGDPIYFSVKLEGI